MRQSKQRWSICSVEGCHYALEYDADEGLFCPTCEMELISQCPACSAPIEAEEAERCGSCAQKLKE